MRKRRPNGKGVLSLQCVLMVVLLLAILTLTYLTGTIVRDCVHTSDKESAESDETESADGTTDTPKPATKKKIRGLSTKTVKHAIPKKLHQIWISRDGKDSNPLPQFCVKESQKMKEVHEADGWEYRLWGNELWDIYKSDAIVAAYFKANFDKTSVAFITDRFRLLILRDYGGVFCDVDAKLVKSFSYLLDKLPPQTNFFAGMRNLEGTLPNAIVEVAVMGSAQHSRVMDGVANMYDPPKADGSVSIPHGGRVGRWIVSFLDMNSVLLNYHFFYADADKLTDESIVLQNGFELGTWRNSEAKSFSPAITSVEKATMLRMYTTLHKTVESELHFTPWLGGVGLLGYGRNGTLSPWEDGLDLMLRDDLAPQVQEKVITKMEAAGYSAEKFWGGFKFWPASADPIVGYKWAFPNIDLRLYATTGNTVILSGNGGKKYNLLKKHFEPFKTVPFEGIKVSVPNHVHEVLTAEFDDYQNVCVSRGWDRHLEKGHESSRVDCSKLYPQYPLDPKWKKLGPATA